MRELRTAVIGIGNMGTAHARCIREGEIPGLELAAVCDLRPERLRWVEANWPGVARTADWRSLLDPALPLDAVIIAVPHPLHCEMAQAFLEAGKHVLSEKPLDIRLSRARKAVAAAEERGLVFAVMFNQRTDPLFIRAREIVRDPAFGEIRRSSWTVTNWYRTQAYYDSGTWRATWAGEGGGVMVNQAPHNLDLWQWICGMPCRLTARLGFGRHHRIEVEDEATLLTEYPNGATGVFTVSTGEYPGTNRLEICGTRGKLVLEDGGLKHWRLGEDVREVSGGSGEHSPRIPMTCETWRPEDKGPAHAGVLRDFARAVLEGGTPIAPAREALNELAVANAAFLSAWQEGAPVTLPVDEARFDALLALRQAESGSSRDPGAETLQPDGRYSERWSVRW